jgi:outer membrane protein
MKRITGIAALIIILAFAGQNAMAQAPKFGHINSEELIQLLPEFDSASVKIEKFRQDLVNALELMSVELNNKSDSYSKDRKILLILSSRQKSRS